ncbi:MAG: BlaI/MecI/CopY family transcriptional regulator [Clostridiales Family XIII bacterium]|jgi:predicted transcriptional regulator|nr:BlaI/MecI/CopY family transcriptional regulator [Clostridiales Family XIII bacterium]
MENYKLYDGEYKFICVIWDAEPIGSMKLVQLCDEKLGWKKSTTFTMLRRLAERGLVRNEKSVVTSLIKREQVQQYEIESLMDKMFDGSVPSFVASFLRGRTISEAELQEIQRMIEEATER